MKNKFMRKLSRILIVCLIALMVFPTIAVLGTAAREPASTYMTPNFMGEYKRTPKQQLDYKMLKTKIWAKNAWGSVKESTQTLEFKTGLMKELGNQLPGLVDSFKYNQAIGGVDAAAAIYQSIELATSIAACCGPYGQLASSAVNLCVSIVKMCMGGEEPDSEMQKMEDNLTAQLTDIKGQLSDIEAQINGLSNDINESTNKIIEELTVAIDNAAARKSLNDFMEVSGKYDFGYDQYRNYLYGELKNNSRANTAYYAKLKEAIFQEVSAETIGDYYDMLYQAIMDNQDAYQDAVLETGTGKSIVQCYYDVISANSELVEEGSSPELMAIMFAYDIYQTEIMADQIILSCNMYQYAQMLLTEKDRYVYGNGVQDKVTKEDIEKGIIEGQINQRIAEFEAQMAKDIAYILATKDSYVIQSTSGDMYEMVNCDPDTYGYVLPGETIYLSTIPDDICEIFGFDATDFAYQVSTYRADGTLIDSNADREVDGVIPKVSSQVASIRVTLTYQGNMVDELTIRVGYSQTFNGGDGTPENPYLIANSHQFKAITDGMDKHYRLINDIDFEGETINPIGQRFNQTDNQVYVKYDEFEGSLDGNGYTIKNVKVVNSEYGGAYVGLFGIISEQGEVADLNLYNVTISASVNKVRVDSDQFYVGMLAGKNSGVIKFCSVDSIGVSDTMQYGVNFVLNDLHKRSSCIDVYVGGIVGMNENIIANCIISNVAVKASSTHDYAGNLAAQNKNNVYVGGICSQNYGYIIHSLVKSSVTLSATAKLIYNPTSTSYPYIDSFAGGIVAKTTTLDGIIDVESYAKIEKVEALLDSQSGYGEKYQNCYKKQNPYIVKCGDNDATDNDINQIKASGVEAEILKTERHYKVTYDYPDKNHAAGSQALNTENLKFYINGEEKAYEIIDIYGFNSQNNSFKEVEQTVVVMFSVETEDGTEAYFAQELEIDIEENKLVDIILVSGLKETYKKDEFSPLGFTFKFEYAVPLEKDEYVTIDEENLSEVQYMSNNNSYGEALIWLRYKDKQFDLKINVICDHNSNFTDESLGYWKVAEVKEATCQEAGYILYECQECHDKKEFYLRKLEHTWPSDEALANNANYKAPTCDAEGNTGRVYCTNLVNGEPCTHILAEGEVIPKLVHEYTYHDQDYHVCENSSTGAHYEAHHYTVTESVQYLDNPDGSKSWKTVYILECACGHKDEKTDTNSNHELNKSLPTIMVNNGYVLPDSDRIVTVYVQLLNNPGVKGANFGIRYDERLQLLSWENGEVLDGFLVQDSKEETYGYNFVWGDTDYFYEKGNVLKLTFKVPNDVSVGDPNAEFEVKVVYAIENGATGGFSTPDGKQYFITKAGTISVVDHLPGDVNCDGMVDVLDAAEIGRYLVRKGTVAEEFANVDLSAIPEGKSTAVDIEDLVAILQYVVGGYGVNLMPSNFDIVLNTNGWIDKALENMSVSIYGDDHTYAQAPTLVRPGYKFLGWSYQMYGGELLDVTGQVLYNHAQKVQTLYAQWELNSLHFVMTDNVTSGSGADIYYTTGYVDIPDDPIREYTLQFVSDFKNYHKDTDGILKYEFLGWQIIEGEIDTETRLYKEFDLIIALLDGHYGKVVLQPVFNDMPNAVDYPNWDIDGCRELVEWYGELGSSIDERKKITNDNQILSKCHKEEDVDGAYYVIYAKHTPIVFSIVFDFGGTKGVDITTENPSSVSNCSISNPYNDAKSYTIGSITKIGNTFYKWADQFGNEYGEMGDPNVTISVYPVDPEEDNPVLTLSARWVPVTDTVTFDSNGGTCSTISKSVTYGNKYGELPEPKRAGYKFLCWRLPNGSEVKEDTLVLIDGAHILTADWENEIYTLTLDPDGGTVSPKTMDVTYNENYGYHRSLPIPTKTGHRFDGWRLNGVPVGDATNVTTIGSHTLKAEWIANSYTVLFDATGGYTSLKETDVTYGAKYGTLPKPTRTGYNFICWTLEDGSEVKEYTTDVKTAGKHTLFAKWELITWKKIEPADFYVSKNQGDSNHSVDKYVNTRDYFDVDYFIANGYKMRISVSYYAVYQDNKGYIINYVWISSGWIKKYQSDKFDGSRWLSWTCETSPANSYFSVDFTSGGTWNWDCTSYWVCDLDIVIEFYK